jgi:hypothetical protein
MVLKIYRGKSAMKLSYIWEDQLPHPLSGELEYTPNIRCFTTVVLKIVSEIHLQKKVCFFKYKQSLTDDENSEML